MNNHKFVLVFRTHNYFDGIKNNNQDSYGWELVDNIEYTDYTTAKAMMAEYQQAFANYCVRIRAIQLT